MRITSKGQVTIPARIREEAGFMPDTEVDFSHDGKGNVRIFRAKKKSKTPSRGDKLVAHLLRQPRIKMTTEEIMKLTRG